jgi:hypothetical protein
MCVNRLENQTASATEPTVADHKLPATNDTMITMCVWDNFIVIVSTSQTNMAQRQKKGEQLKSSNLTHLQGFHVSGVVLLLECISKDVLWKWAIAKGRSKGKTLSK